MSGVPEASPPNRGRYESVSDILPVLEKFKELRSFWETRDAVLSGERSEAKRTHGPRKFNIVQSATGERLN
jgi:hypothetical protein